MSGNCLPALCSTGYAMWAFKFPRLTTSGPPSIELHGGVPVVACPNAVTLAKSKATRTEIAERVRFIKCLLATGQNCSVMEAGETPVFKAAVCKCRSSIKPPFRYFSIWNGT